MKKYDIIVIGSSAGGIPALIDLVKNIPREYAGSVFIVQHLSANVESMLPGIISYSGNLPAVHPKDGEKFKAGHIYIAPPDNHMLLDKDRILVKRGPKENLFRPSIDALFRSAGYEYGTRTVGIVLSGMLNDGTSGLWTVKRLGGIAVIQDPRESLYQEMPTSVLEYVKVDYKLKASEIGPLLVKLYGGKPRKKPDITPEEMKRIQAEVIIAAQGNAYEMGILKMGEIVPFSCPECHGTLIGIDEGITVRFRCHTGHAFSAEALLESISNAVEEELWQVMNRIEETNILLNRLGNHFSDIGKKQLSSLYFEKADKASKKAHAIHDAVYRYQMSPVETHVEIEENEFP
jgi:two-component system chemotaxis response regulator CheB